MSFYDTRSCLANLPIPCNPMGTDEVVDLSRNSISFCRLSSVNGSSVQVQCCFERLEKLHAINSWTAAELVFDAFGDFNFRTGGIHSEILGRLSFSPLTEDMIRWTLFQIRWIIWTLASFERRYYRTYLNRLLHKETVFTLISSRYATYSAGEGKNVGHPPPEKRFKSNCGMSPLQRCCEISTLIWPLCVCVAMDGNEFMISDGWWWSPFTLDGPLSSLVEKVFISSTAYSPFKD